MTKCLLCGFKTNTTQIKAKCEGWTKEHFRGRFKQANQDVAVKHLKKKKKEK